MVRVTVVNYHNRPFYEACSANNSNSHLFRQGRAKWAVAGFSGLEIGNIER